jgi:hypothetical protein
VRNIKKIPHPPPTAPNGVSPDAAACPIEPGNQ